MVIVFLRRLNGKLLEFSSIQQEWKLESIEDLKTYLAATDTESGSPSSIRLFKPVLDENRHLNHLVELANTDRIKEAGSVGCSGADRAWYFNEEADVKKSGLQELYDPAHPFTLFGDQVSRLAHGAWRESHEAGSAFMDAWVTLARFTVFTLSPVLLNAVDADGPTLLTSMYKCLMELEGTFVNTEPFEELFIEVVQHAALEPRTINRVLNAIGDYDIGFGRGPVPLLWSFIRRKKPYYHCRSHGGGRLFANIGFAMLKRGHLSEEVMNFRLPRGDTLLQHILEPTDIQHAGDKREGEARLALALVERSTLCQLLCKNEENMSTVSYASMLPVHAMKGDWRSVKSCIISQVKRQLEATLRPIAGLQCDELLSGIDDFEEAGGSLDLRSGFPLEGVLRSRAQTARKKWLRMGWRFKSETEEGQLSELMSYYSIEKLMEEG